ncbi:MAG: class I SAM-dependent methyltransferase [Anaerolineales bacterium]
MPITPNFLERLLMLKLNQVPAPTLDMYGVIANRAISIALRLGIFEILREGPMTPGEVARRTKVSERGIALLLGALEPIGYLKKVADRYNNTALVTKWMLQDSPTTIVHLFLFFDTVIERCGYLEETIREGKPRLSGWEWFNQHPDSWEAYYAGMLDGARLSADEVVSKVSLNPHVHKLLDVGGGHGLYSIRFCQRYADLHATIFDWPQALKIAERTITTEGLNERIELHNGDIWKDDLGRDYDVALLFNVIHMYSPDKNIVLIQRVKNALKQGGILVIMDQVASKGRGSAAKAIAKLQGLQLFNSVMGQTYPADEIALWLEHTGFSRIQSQMLLKAPSSGLVIGIKSD